MDYIICIFISYYVSGTVLGSVKNNREKNKST